MERKLPPALVDGDVRAILEDSAGALWVGTEADGVYRLDEGGFEHLPPIAGDPTSLQDSDAWVLFEDRDGTVWVGTYGGGLSRFEPATGEELWRVDRAGLGSAFDEMDFESTPIVQAGKVYVVVRRKRSFGFEDCFLWRFDADDGAVEFRTHLGSASTGGFGYRRSALTIPALFEDTVYVVSNLGTIAAVDGHSGRVRACRQLQKIHVGGRGQDAQRPVHVERIGAFGRQGVSPS